MRGRCGFPRDAVVRLTHVRPGVFVDGLVEGERGRFDVSQCSVERPGEVGGRD